MQLILYFDNDWFVYKKSRSLIDEQIHHKLSMKYFDGIKLGTETDQTL